MTMNKTIGGLAHYEKIWWQALESTRGITITELTHGAAINLRQSLYMNRTQIRRQSCREYPDPNDPRHNASPFDGLSVRVVHPKSQPESNKAKVWSVDIFPLSEGSAYKIINRDTNEEM